MSAYAGRFDKYGEARGLVLDEAGVLRSVTHCIEVVALLLAQIDEAEAGTRDMHEKLLRLKTEG